MSGCVYGAGGEEIFLVMDPGLADRVGVGLGIPPRFSLDNYL